MIMPHFERLLKVCDMQGWEEGHKTLTCDRAGLVAILTEMLRASPFDEEWYLARYPDVADAVERGEFPSGRDHYIRFGYFEGRLPGLNGFDAEAYCSSYPDLEYILLMPRSDMAAKEHFIQYGYQEGRFAPSVKDRAVGTDFVPDL